MRNKILLLGSGELGKEVVIALQRLGQYVIAVDSYPDAPAMQVAHEFEVINMLDGDALDKIVKKHNPDAIGLQETKVHDDDFPYDIPESLGYKAHIHGQKGHYGVAIFTKDEPESVSKGFETDTEESQKRFISVTLKRGKKKINVSILCQNENIFFVKFYGVNKCAR